MSGRARERRDEILRLANSTGLASVEQLSARFQVTSSTIRRDLAQLTAAGRLARTYGGAIALTPPAEASFSQRSGEAAAAKRGIALWAAGQVASGETILLDSGSTVGALAGQLRHARHLTVVTPSLAALVELADVEGIQLDCLGGTLRPLSRGFVGPIAELTLERLSFDRAFLGTDAVTAERGICEADLTQSRLKELAMRRAKAVYVLAHAAKLGQEPFHAWTPLPPDGTIVTDDTATEEQVRPFRDRGIAVVRVDRDGVRID